jgi:hypothetical protein
MLGVFIWAVLLIILGACLLPWWFLPGMVVYCLFVYGVDWKRIDKQSKRKARKRRKKAAVA